MRPLLLVLHLNQLCCSGNMSWKYERSTMLGHNILCVSHRGAVTKLPDRKPPKLVGCYCQAERILCKIHHFSDRHIAHSTLLYVIISRNVQCMMYLQRCNILDAERICWPCITKHWTGLKRRQQATAGGKGRMLNVLLFGWLFYFVFFFLRVGGCLAVVTQW